MSWAFFDQKFTAVCYTKTLRKFLTNLEIFFRNFPKLLWFIFLNLCLGTWECEQILKKNIFWGIGFYAQIGFLKFYVINSLDNPPFQSYYSNLHTISFQKMHIIWVVQFFTKKTSPTGLCRVLNPPRFFEKYVNSFWWFWRFFQYLHNEKLIGPQKNSAMTYANCTGQKILP